MSEHTSKLLTLDKSAPDCWCGHPDDRHHVEWVTRRLNSGAMELDVPCPVVHCMECMEEQLAAQRFAAKHNLAMVRSLIPSKPEAETVAEMLELTERMFTLRAEGRPWSEIQPLIRQHDRLLQKVKELNLLANLDDLGNA